MSKRKLGQIIACILIMIGIIVSVYSAWQRFDIERSHKQASVLLDFSQVKELCAIENIPVSEGLSRFASYATGVDIKEPTISDLANDNNVVVKSGADMALESDEELGNQGIVRSDLQLTYNYLFFTDPADLLRVQKHILAKIPGAVADVVGDNQSILVTSLPDSIFGSLGVGFSQKDLDTIEQAGFKIVAQIRDCNYPFTVQGIDAEMADLKGHDLMAVGFNDLQVPGANLPIAQWSKLKKHWLESIQKLGVPVITIEFYDQKGLDSVVADLDQNVLRMHAIGEQEMLNNLTQETALQRLQLAASERNMKVLLVRFLPFSNIQQNVDYFINIGKALWAKGIVVSNPVAVTPLVPNPIFLFLIALAVLAGMWLLAVSFRIPVWLSTLGALLGCLLAVGLVFTGRIYLLQRGFAFFAVITFPVLAVIRIVSDNPARIWKAVGKMILASAISLIGALLMVGLMADGTFMLKLHSFSGVKFAVMLPLVLIFIWFFFLKDKKESAITEFMDLIEKPLTLKYVLIGLLIGLVLIIYVLRSGNDTMSVSSLERSFRAFLDNVMVVRPRTKEFLLGYPLLLFSFYYGYSKKMLPVLLLGSIGLVSSVNTFAHIHTPVMVSVFRTFNGLVLGIVTGLILILASVIFTKWWGKIHTR